ncbi:MAG: 30S ribosomal protein S16 [Candidatus Pacebacteria bacterium]|nr:30S ribosomal protein S16 [Candidatus Paceibacterota bacterium]
MIRFQRIGRTNDPAFRIVVLEKERAAKAGNIVELLGTYNPKSKALTLNEENTKGWIAKGAQPTDSIHNLLVAKGVIEGKKVNVLPRKSPQKSEAALAAEKAAAEAAVAAAKAAPTQEVGAPAESVGEEAAEATPMVEEVPTEAEVAAEALPAPTQEVGEPTESVGSEETPAA